MASIARLKDRARKHEQKEDWEAAIKAYQQVLQQEEAADEVDLELGLYNRIGDLHLRLGHTDEAVSYYEAAADKYAESGFLNNAIALCNKALRHRPERPEIYLKLSQLCAEQGFETDARRWILEYADRRMRAGQVEEALQGLEEFADMSDAPEIRETLAQHLAANGRPDEAVEQLRHAYRVRVDRGQAQAAEEVAEKARAIDPSVELAGAGAGAAGADTEWELEPAETGAGEPAEPSGDEGLAGLETRTDPVGDEAVEGGEIEGLETRSELEVEEEPGGVGELEVTGTGAVEGAEADEAGTVGGLETFEEGEVADEAGAGAEPVPDAGHEPELDEEEPEPLPFLETGYDEEAEEEPEPLPLLDEGAEEAEEEPEPVEAAPVAEEPATEVEPEEPEPLAAEAGAGVEEPGVEEQEADEAAVEEPAVEEPAVDEAAVDEAAIDEAEGELSLDISDVEVELGDHSAEAMRLDLDELDLSLETGDSSASLEVEDVDLEAVIQRCRELVSRGLTSEALRELQLLAHTHPDEETLRDAVGIVNEIVRRDANDIAALQRRVEYAGQLDDTELLVDAYTDLADALARLGSETKAQAMYERVLSLDPANEVAREALGAAAPDDEDAVDLDAVLRELDPEEVERVRARSESDPDFQAMLSQFKSKVTEQVASGEAGDHYDLGLAFKEMGLIDEAIAEFQTALTSGAEDLKVYEELGQCFIQKGQYNVALKIFNRALQVPYAEENELLGVYYHMGQCHEELGQREKARGAYEKVLAIDESFADVPERVARL